jgi:hypothetical protein
MITFAPGLETLMPAISLSSPSQTSASNPLRDSLPTPLQKRPRHVIVDLRGEGVGNYVLARSFAKQIDSLVPGEVFIVTDGGTFSLVNVLLG